MVLLLSVTLGACSEDDGGAGAAAGAAYRAQHIHTLRVGTTDNAEVVKALPGSDLAILVSSKARKLTLLRVGADRLEVAREKSLFPDDTSESELTHVDVVADGTWAVLTRTLIEKDPQGAQTRCGGELVFVDARDADTFGDVLGQVDVGPMPDSVDISDDGRRVASADERDGPDAWGKCEVPDAKPSLSIVDVSGGPAAATRLHRVEIVDADTGPREPESVVFAADSDLVVATLQDSHEVLFLRVSALDGVAAPTSANGNIVALPANALGAKPWPDGVARFEDAAGVEHFVTAGEWNDTFSILDASGTVLTTVDVSAVDLPESLPRVLKEDYPLFSPDSITTFSRGGHSYLSFTLRHSGAVAVYDASDVAEVRYVTAVAVGDDEQGGKDEDGSTIRPEGIAASTDGGFVLTANEGESSVSLILPVD